MTYKGKQRSQRVLNALILLACDEGEYQTERSTNEEIARVKKKGNRIYERKADGDFEAHLVAISCSELPDGFARWSLRMLADKVVKLGYIDSISYETVRGILKKRNQTLATKRMGNST